MPVLVPIVSENRCPSIFAEIEGELSSHRVKSAVEVGGDLDFLARTLELEKREVSAQRLVQLPELRIQKQVSPEIGVGPEFYFE